jgi:hypothetical protein
MVASRADTETSIRNHVRREMLESPTKRSETNGNDLGLHFAGARSSIPVHALLLEFSGRGHNVHSRTLSTGVEMGRRLGFTTDTIDPRIEAIVHEDWKASNSRAALKMAVDVFCRRAEYEVADFTDAVTQTRPDALVVDVNCWGALSVADAGDTPWACFSPTHRLCNHLVYRPSGCVWLHCPVCWAGFATPRCGPS